MEKPLSYLRHLDKGKPHYASLLDQLRGMQKVLIHNSAVTLYISYVSNCYCYWYFRFSLNEIISVTTYCFAQNWKLHDEDRNFCLIRIKCLRIIILYKKTSNYCFKCLSLVGCKLIKQTAHFKKPGSIEMHNFAIEFYADARKTVNVKAIYQFVQFLRYL